MSEMPFAALIAEWTVVHSSLGLLKGREEQTNLSHPKPSPSPLYSIFMFVDGRSWMQWYRESCPGRDCLMTYSITRSLSWILGWKSDKSEHKIQALLKNLEKKVLWLKCAWYPCSVLRHGWFYFVWQCFAEWLWVRHSFLGLLCYFPGGL